MRALRVQPGQANSLALEEVPSPKPIAGSLSVRALALGICGTDREIVAGEYGWPAPGKNRLILGHESLGEVEEAPAQSGFARGDLVAGFVRRPDPVPCPACAAGEWDMCRNGRYTERGIKERDGYGAEHFCVRPEFAIKLPEALRAHGVLLEPTSVVAKCWDQVERIGRRGFFQPRSVLVTGAGPIGLLAALLGVQRGLDVHVFDRTVEGPKPELVRALGAIYHSGDFPDIEPDIVIECTGASAVVLAALGATGNCGIVCLAGVSSGSHKLNFDVAGLNRSMVLENDVVFGSVNANRRHYELAAQALVKAESGWLARLITRRVPLSRWREAFERRGDDIKVVLDFTI